MADDLHRQVEEFLYREAELLDERKFKEWLALLAADVRYWVPARHNPWGRAEEIAQELSRPEESYYFNDTKKTLEIRVERLYDSTAWAENPPSRTRRLISNIRVKKDDGLEVEVHSNFLVYRTRLETDRDLFVGTRRDILRRVDGEWKIARRTVILDEAVLNARNISIFL